MKLKSYPFSCKKRHAKGKAQKRKYARMGREQEKRKNANELVLR